MKKMEIRFHFFFENNIDVEFLEDPMLNTIGCYMVTILVSKATWKWFLYHPP